MNKEELLRKNLDRFDHYISAAHNKANYLMTFNTFILGTLLFKYNDLLKGCNSCEKYMLIVGIIFCALAAFVALIFCFRGSNIFLKSNNETAAYHSKLFFGSVKDMKEEVYIEKVSKLKDKDIEYDLSKQTYSLAIGCHKKYWNLRIAQWLTLWGVLLLSGLILIFKLMMLFDNVGGQYK